MLSDRHNRDMSQARQMVRLATCNRQLYVVEHGVPRFGWGPEFAVNGESSNGRRVAVSKGRLLDAKLRADRRGAGESNGLGSG